MSFEIQFAAFAPRTDTVHFTSNRTSDGLRRLWNDGYTSFDENVLEGEDAPVNVAALLTHLKRDQPSEFASLAVRYFGEPPGVGPILEHYGDFIVEVRHEAIADALIFNGDVKNLARDFAAGHTAKPHVIDFDRANPTATLATLAALVTRRRSALNPRLIGHYPEARLLRRLRAADVLAVWVPTHANSDDLDFLVSQGGTKIPAPPAQPKPPPFGRKP